ncbi:unnamed protein product [Rotaria sordida]|uniref:PiggyBac transposable element-derived protein domain-containing protein n=1 Tax=Rotaria sordida TaxID=392033 RepID=A0A815CTR3_9BILA|nr:unnamed protein product [Rotaria sordida]CAF1567614.1 unnamed protein product [Rotaria sordida]
MDKRKRSNFNQSKYWLDDSEHFDDKSSDEDTNVNHDSEDAEIPSTLQDTSDESNDGTVEKDSGDESDENSVDTESMSDEEPPRRRAKRKPQVKPTPVKIFSSKSGRQWTSKEPSKKKVPIANILRQRTGVGRPAADIQTLKEAFQLLITQEMVLLLVKETNRRAHLLLEQWSEENPDEKNTAYPLNAEVYLGRQPGAPTAAKDKDRIRNLVKQLIHPWINTGRTITTDNYFTSAELAEDLLGVQTTLVGTIRRNKKEIPRELQPDTHRPEQSSIFCFDRQLTLVSYVPKKAYAVILLSSLHHDQTIADEKKKKPEIILYHNNTKGGVDRMDQMVQTYSCKRKTKRWPMTFFFNIIDVGALAACIVWLTKNPQWNEKKCYRRRIFLMELGYDLIQSHLERRQHQPQALQKGVRIAMQAIGLTVATSQPNTVSTDTAKQRCHLCPRERDRKVVTHCSSCNIPCCPDHHKVICTVCNETFLG